MKMGTVLGTIFGATAGVVAGTALSSKKVVEKTKKADKFKQYYNMLNEWLLVKNRNQSLVDYFQKKEYKSIAIYGMGEMGKRLFEELKDTGIEIVYAVDKSGDSTYLDIPLYSSDDVLPEADVMVVTAIFDYDEIEEAMCDVVDMPIVSLDDVISEVRDNIVE